MTKENDIIQENDSTMRTLLEGGNVSLPRAINLYQGAIKLYLDLTGEEYDPAKVGEFDQEGLMETIVNLSSIRFGPVDLTRIAFQPKKSHPGDAGFDLTVIETTVIRPGEFKDLPTNVWCAMPPGWWGLLQGRSSTLRKLGLMVNPGVIDNGYRGELFAGAFNLGPTNVVVEVGQRVAQFIPMYQPGLTPAWTEVGPPPGERGSRGFGSTGL